MNYTLLLLGLLIATSACTSSSTSDGVNESSVIADSIPPEKESEFNDPDEIKVLPDGTKYLIHPNKIRSGGPPKDGIPSIDNPKFVSVEEANSWLNDDDLGAVIIHKGVKRFYPFQILVWHEIVNEDIAEDAIMITYCPLCGSIIGFERTIDGEAVEFGTSGKLFNSNLVMYDRKTDTYWTQIGGRAIVGELTGRELKLFPVSVVKWGDWMKAHPDSEILSRQTGHVRLYGSDPYGDYYTSRYTIFPVEEQDDRLHPKAVVFGIIVNGSAKAYPEAIFKEESTITDEIGGANITLTRDAVGIITFTDTSTGQEIPYERDFWFAWFAFYPETELYET